MRRLIICFFLFFLINIKGESKVPSFINLKLVTEWCEKLVIKGLSYSIGTGLLFDSTKKNFEKILADVEKISVQLKSFQNYIDQKIDKMLRILVHDVRDNVILQIGRTQLNNHINAIDRFHNKVSKLKNKRISSETMMKSFITSVLWGPNNLPTILEQIYQLIHPSARYIVPGFMELMVKDAQDHIQFDCNKFISAQQRMFYLYIHVVLAEMKGLTTLTYAYSVQQIFDKSYNYSIELNSAKQAYRMRVRAYYKKLHRLLSSLPREVHRCDVDPTKRNIDFIEMYKFSRAKLFNEQQLTADQRHYWSVNGTCRYSCSELPKAKCSYDIRTAGLRVYNCQYIGGHVVACPAGSRSHREYLSWKTKNDIFGRNENCTNPVDKSGFFDKYIPLAVPFGINECDECLCSVEIIAKGNKCKDRTAIAAISLSPQISDIANNMIVTGVKFVVYENAIHLQIQQNKFRPDGVANNASVWKEITKVYYDNPVPQDYRLKYVSLNHERRSIYLDNIMVPNNYAVTGVKFTVVVQTSSFALAVYATPFDISTGLLSPRGSDWFSYKDQNFESIWTRDYNRDRDEIILDEPDDPTKCSEYNYDIETNKLIKFIHTDLRKDAGQNTVPFFDAQPVDTRPPFPLGGIGLYLKGRVGYGGYISPRIYTIDVSTYVKGHKKKSNWEFKQNEISQ